MTQPFVAFIGYDPGERLAYQACRYSLLDHASRPVFVRPLDRAALEHAGLYRRRWQVDGKGRFVDLTDGQPFSTAFSFTRFLVPVLMQWRGWALFCDSDFFWRADAAALFALADPRRAVQCVQHRHAPAEAQKMRGQVQTRYWRKNWSSLVLWNCGHGANRYLTPERVNTARGQWLHGFAWLDDQEIGALPEAWNWLEGHSEPAIEPKAVHYTRGTPDLPGHEDAPFADDWWAAAHAGDNA